MSWQRRDMTDAWVHALDAGDATTVTDYGAAGVRALLLAEGRESWTATVLVCEAGGALGAHVAGRDQIFVPLDGRAWLEVDGVRRDVSQGSYGVVRAGQPHAKGAITRLVVLVLQSPTIHVPAGEPRDADGVAPSATPSGHSGSDEASPS